MTGKLSLYELQLIIRDSLYMALPDMYWVIAEISELKENYAGHCYLELIEKQPDEKNIKARIRAVMWCRRYSFLKSFFENSTGDTLREGIKVLVKVKVEYHELYGLSLVICDIDPAFTVGDMAVKRQQIIRRLEQEGIFTMNKDLELPLSIQRIAVISSAGAAGYTDFINQLTHNSYGYAFYTKLFESAMQGSDTEKGITGALDRIAAHAGLFDIVAIIRGGGSQVDLSWFDNYNIAYHVTQFPLPVLTGIGHDKDMSITDMVANTALKTPTALAGFIVEHAAAAEARLIEVGNAIKEKSRLILERKKNRIETCGLKLVPLSKMLISRISELLARAETALKNDSRHITRMKKAEIENLQRALVILSPDNVLSRGYTITLRNGRIIKKSIELNGGDLIDTRFSDGNITSRVLINTNPGRKESELND
jgi:exodeoxyribonuclease VII large subunit